MLLSLVLTLLAFFAAGAGGCEDPKAKDVRAADDRINQAIDSGNGAAAIKLLTRDTLNRYTRLVKAAREMSRQSLRGLPFVDRMDVLLIRARFSAADLKNMDGAGYYKTLIDRRMIQSTVAEGMRAGKVKVKGNSATMEWWAEGDPEPSMGFYEFEDGEWKEDQVAFAQWEDRLLTKNRKEAGMTEEELIEEIIAETLSRPMPDGL